jgi:hypothetical protein
MNETGCARHIKFIRVFVTDRQKIINEEDSIEQLTAIGLYKIIK